MIWFQHALFRMLFISNKGLQSSPSDCFLEPTDKIIQYYKDNITKFEDALQPGHQIVYYSC